MRGTRSVQSIPALSVYEKLRERSAAIARNDHLAPAGKRAELMKAATEFAPTIGRARRQRAAATKTRLDRQDALLGGAVRPRDKDGIAGTQWDIIIWTHLKSLSQSELIALASTNPDILRVALTAPLALPNLSAPAREQLLTAHLQATCAKQLAAFEDEDEALALAKASLDAATGALHEATGMQHGAAFDQWMSKAAPPTAKDLEEERQQSAGFEVERLGREANMLPISERLQLRDQILDTASNELRGRS